MQTIQFAILFDRAAGNGYGRMDLCLHDFYRRDMDAGILARREAREYIAEMYMKLRGLSRRGALARSAARCAARQSLL